MLGDLGKKLEAIGKLELLEDVSRAAEDYFANMDHDLRDRETEIHAALTNLSRGEILRQKGDHEHAKEEYNQAESKLTILAAMSPQRAANWASLSRARGALATMAILNKDAAGEEAWLQKARDAIDEALSLVPQDQEYRREKLTIQASQLSTASMRSRPTTSAEWETLVQRASQLARESPDAINIRLVSFLCASAGESDEERGETEKALNREKLACDLIFELRDRVGDDAVVQLDLADSLMRLGLLEKKLGRMKEAATALQAGEVGEKAGRLRAMGSSRRSA
jgi:tetratricopeptide (TPR) repeat protein